MYGIDRMDFALAERTLNFLRVVSEAAVKTLDSCTQTTVYTEFIRLVS
jgi:hypothetical protein